eukprot:gene4824-5072_t
MTCRLLHTDIEAGWGIVPDMANLGKLKAVIPCPANTYECPIGRYTRYVVNDGQYQDQIEDCLVPAGSGTFQANASDPWAPPNRTASMTVLPCPIGWYGVVCAAGYGIPSSKPTSIDPADCALCTCGTFNTGGSLRCSDCPTTVFNHPVGDTYISDGINFGTGMTGPEYCVPKHSQFPTPAGHIFGIDDSLFAPAQPVTDVAACILKCPANQCCISQFEETSTGNACKIAALPPVGPNYTGARLYYKLPPSELIAAASVNNTISIKTKAAGIYTRCVMNGTWESLAAAGKVGWSANASLVEETNRTTLVEWGECADETSCRIKCEGLATCWGFIYVPSKGWAIRNGEDQIGFRSFMISPDFCSAPADTPEDGPASKGITCSSPPSGLFANDVELVTVTGGACACKDWQDGYVPVKPNGKNKVDCERKAMYLSDSATSDVIPANNGIWVNDITGSSMSCYSMRSCWDMCFFCDGRPRYSYNSCGAERKGKGMIADPAPTPASPCTNVSCPLAPPVNVTNTAFYQVCNNFRKNVPFQVPQSPFRPLNMPQQASLFQVAAPLPSGYPRPDWGQDVLLSFGSVTGSC